MLEEFLHTAPVGPRSAAAEQSLRRSYRQFIRLGSGRPEVWSWLTALATLALIALLTVVGFWIEPLIKGPNFAILYVLSVVFSALRWGRRAAILSAILGALCFDYFFVPPVRSFVLGDISYLITLIGLLTVGLLTSILTVTAREEARSARQREAHTAALYSLTKVLVVESELERILDAIGRHVRETFGRPVAVLLPDSGVLRIRFLSPELAFDEREKAAAAWVFENGEEAGCGTGRFSDSKMRYRPLKTWQGVVGVLGILSFSTKELLPPDQRELLGAFMNHAALAITRADLAKKAQRTELLQETDKLQKALLNSVSHDLRTPLVSVIGGLNTVLQDAALLDAATQRTLLETARDEAVRLNRLIQNLLDMTRLEGGSFVAKTEPCDVHDVVGAAFEQLGEVAQHHPISVTIAPDLPLVPMDHVLIVQVLVNLLDNALKYSPSNAPIAVDARLDDDQLQIRIADRGKEIPTQELDRVFDKFFRGTSGRGSRGVGLGLSICKGFIEAHRGRIWAKHRPEGGTEIAFSLPMGPVQWPARPIL